MKGIPAIIAVLWGLQVLAQQPANKDTVVCRRTEAKYSRALALARQYFEKVEDGSAGDTAYIGAASRLGSAYYSLVRFDSANYYASKACEKTRQLYGETSILYGSALSTVAISLVDLGRFQEAEQGFQKASAILSGRDSLFDKSAYAKCLIQYAGFFLTTGSLNKAEELCLSASRMAQEAPVDQYVYITSLDRLSWLYEKLGLYAKQEAILARMFQLQRHRITGNSVEYCNAIAAQAAIYQRNGKLKKADSMYRAALALKEKAFGKGSAATIAILNHVGIVNMALRRYKLAESTLKQAMDIVCKDLGGEASAMYPYCVKNLARLYVLTNRKALAEPLYLKCLAVYDRLGLTFNTGRLNTLHDMADLLYADDPVKAAIYLQKAVDAENRQLLNKLDFLSESELLAYVQRIRDVAESPYRFLQRYKSPEIAGAAYNSRLLASGIGLQNTRVLYQNMAGSKDSSLAGLWRDYLQEKSLYTNLLLTAAGQRNVNTDSVAAVLNSQEKDLLRRSVDYRNMRERLAYTWQDVQRHLQTQETAIEFIRFNKGAVARYAALLIRPEDTAPQFIPLCSEPAFLAVAKTYPYKAAKGSRGLQSANQSQDIRTAMYDLLWRPLAPYLAHTRRIYYSPDGLLHRVAFAAIPCKKAALLCDQYELVELLSTRQIALQENRPPALTSIAMFGGINYNRQAPDTGSAILAYRHPAIRGTEADSFRFLPNSLTEVNTIDANARAVRRRSILFTGDNATEAAFRNLGGQNSPEVIHFATHGFTVAYSHAKNRAGAAFRASYNPLLHCGLVMAGGNKGWKGRAGVNEDDGILTGLEISSVQLPNTQLAVLSACETGLGEIAGSEGVFGLQRAFKLAGVNYVMASLWQVPDKETAEFMETFYAHWFSGRSIRQAFLQTQQIMRKKYSPYCWAAFTLVQ